MLDDYKSCPTCNGAGKIMCGQPKYIEIYKTWRHRYPEWKPLYDQFVFHLPDKKYKIIKEMEDALSNGFSICQELFEELESNLKTTVELRLKYEAIRAKGKAEDKAHWDTLKMSQQERK